MFILRIGKDLSNCSNGYLYKVIGSDYKTVIFIDNNGEESIARKNSDKWDFNPTCDINEARIGSKFIEPTPEPPKIENSITINNNNKNNDSYGVSSTTGLAIGLALGSTLF